MSDLMNTSNSIKSNDMKVSFTKKVFENFRQIQTELFSRMLADESLTLTLRAESSDFIRWNQSLIRQNTSVEQAQLSMSFIKGSKSQSMSFPFYLDYPELRKRCLLSVGLMRDSASKIPDNPYQVKPTMEGSSEQWITSSTPLEQMVQDIHAVFTGSDAVGILCTGPVIEATANNMGTSHWYCSDRYFLDYSIYNGPKAATSTFAEAEWSKISLEKNFHHTKDALKNLERPKIELKPGNYRVYLGPAAIQEILDMLSWNGPFSYASKQRGQSPFKKLISEQVSLSSKLNLKENFHLGLSPRFNDRGELAPTEIELIKNGKTAQLLVNSQSAKEYKTTGNGANSSESPRSIEMSGGDLEEKDILKKLGTGLYLSNLHYLNWSDKESARFTGMTRYACFWVENGEIVGPIQDLRFDESLYNIWGPHLEAITKEQYTTPSIMTYGHRSLSGKRNPGMLISSMHFTL